MAELWGAPNGIIAAEEMQRKNFLSGLEAQKVLLDVQEQPVKLDKMRAETLHQLTLSGLNQAQINEKQRVAEMQRAMTEASVAADAELAKRDQLIAGAAVQGRNATVADLGKDGKVPVNTRTARLEETIRQAEKRGASELDLVPLRKELSTILQQDASALHQTAQAFEQQALTRIKTQEELASLANYAKKGPRQYAEALQQAMQIPGVNLSRFPPVWSPVVIPMLDAITSGVLKEKDRIDLQIKQQQANAASARAAADQARAGTDAMVASERVKLMQARRARIEASIGDGPGEVSEARRATTELKRQQIAAKDRAEFPQIPLDPSGISINRSYTTMNGEKVRAVLDPNGTQKNANGQRFSLVRITKAKKPVDDGEED
jgi:hypothetical protein